MGDGISLALRSGALAASCLGPFFAGKTSLSEAATNYRQLYRQSLLPVFRASSKIRQMLKFPQRHPQAAADGSGENSCHHALRGQEDQVNTVQPALCHPERSRPIRGRMGWRSREIPRIKPSREGFV